ncbi:MAG TPA: hypothetical protein VKY92_11280 [Verrucomicrobiae bacterium]|nr:hypothetical protein [Verrucomicrobiae bacterium]
MKKSQATTFLMFILVASALASVLFCLLYIHYARELAGVQRSVAQAQGYRAGLVSLINDVMEYSTHNPAINPILEGAGLKPGASTNKPAAK